MTEWFTLLATAVLALVIGFFRRQLIAASLQAIAFFGALWLLTIAAITFGWYDIDGMIDCSPRCTRAQDAARVVLLATPAIAGALLLVALASAIAGRLQLSRRV